MTTPIVQKGKLRQKELNLPRSHGAGLQPWLPGPHGSITEYRHHGLAAHQTEESTKYREKIGSWV